MKKFARDLYLAAGAVDQTKVGIIIFVLSLAMFVAAAGAPDAGGGSVH